ncbi:uncharacterized protein A4U43_C08F24470 [Asparagus officinalis]|nr:uncharacterized protein A4U43_C08F24470 [Asparagus officinalis]
MSWITILPSLKRSGRLISTLSTKILTMELDTELTDPTTVEVTVRQRFGEIILSFMLKLSLEDKRVTEEEKGEERTVEGEEREGTTMASSWNPRLERIEERREVADDDSVIERLDALVELKINSEIHRRRPWPYHSVKGLLLERLEGYGMFSDESRVGDDSRSLAGD